MEFHIYNDFSDFSFYKPELTNFGVQALLIFHNNGLPIFSRFYDQSLSTNNDNDILIITAFISSITHYIENTTDELFSDFGIGSSRYYLKFHEDKIYCIVLSEIVSQRITGESLVLLMEMTLQSLIKSFIEYYNLNPSTKLFDMSFLEQFILQLDTILRYNFKNAITELKSMKKEHHDMDNFKVTYTNSDQYGPINHQLLIKGIHGLVVFDKHNNPLIIRDYALEKNYEKNIQYYSSIAMAVKKFAENNLGVVTDIGFKSTKALVKQKKDEMTICLFVSGVLYWRVTGEVMSMFLELTLHDILRSFSSYLEMFQYDCTVGLSEKDKAILSEQVDLLLLENSKVALEELNN